MPAEAVSVHKRLELPEVKPLVEQHRRFAVMCPGCRARVPAPRPVGAASTPFGPGLYATAVYLGTFQALSCERLQKVVFDLFGLHISQGGLTGILRRAEMRFEAGREAGLLMLWRATVVASDETGVRIKGTNSYRWVFRCEEAVVQHAALTRGGCVVHEIMGGHRPAVIQRKNTNGYRAMWSAKGEVAVRTVVVTARMTSDAGTFSTVLATVGT